MRRVIPLVDGQREHLCGQRLGQRPIVSLHAAEGPMYRAVDPMIHQTAAQGVTVLHPDRQDQRTRIRCLLAVQREKKLLLTTHTSFSRA